MRLAQRDRGRLRGGARHPAADHAEMGAIGVDEIRDLAPDAVIPVLAEGKPEEVMPPPLRRWNAVRSTRWRPTMRPGGPTRRNPRQAGRTGARAGAAHRRSALSRQSILHRTRNDLVRIHEELHAAPVAALTQGRVRALAAMGGMGKTTLANEYARRYWRLYPQILWVDARAGLESGFALLFDKLFPAGPAGLKQPDKARLVLAELSGASSGCW